MGIFLSQKSSLFEIGNIRIDKTHTTTFFVILDVIICYLFNSIINIT